MVACYIDSAYPALLHFAYKYADSPERAILASANAGGENVARGSLLGALLGAAHGMNSFPDWTRELKGYNGIMQEIQALVAVSQTSEL
jgi:ADP-ribosylglycohydrolase